MIASFTNNEHQATFRAFVIIATTPPVQHSRVNKPFRAVQCQPCSMHFVLLFQCISTVHFEGVVLVTASSIVRRNFIIKHGVFTDQTLAQGPCHRGPEAMTPTFLANYRYRIPLLGVKLLTPFLPPSTFESVMGAL